MSERQANYPFNIYSYDDNVQGDHLGGANDLASAAALAGAYFVAKQSSSPSVGWGVGVDEDDVGLVAYVGMHQGD